MICVNGGGLNAGSGGKKGKRLPTSQMRQSAVGLDSTRFEGWQRVVIG